MSTLARTADDLVGTFHTFGSEGPAYEVIGKRDDETIRIRVLETGEEADYPAREAFADPKAQ